MIAGEVSYHWVHQAVLNARRLPPAGAVRVEELLNAFPYRLDGGVAAAGVRAALECGPCPWDDRARLVLVAVEGPVDGSRLVAASLEFDPVAVDRYRLLGFGAAGKAVPEGEPSPAMIPAGHRIKLMLQWWPAGDAAAPAGVLRGRVTLDRVDHPFELPLPAAASWDESSVDFRHAAVIAGAALWLAESKVEPQPRPGRLGELAAGLLPASGDPEGRLAEGLRIVLGAAELAGR
jgi:hypothetical protein